MAYAAALEHERGGLGNGNDIDASVRDSGVRWLERSEPELAWLFEIVDLAVHRLTTEYHYVRYRYDGCPKLQFTEYRKGEYYREHIDCLMNTDGQEIRKMSCSILLSDPSDFEGGEFAVNGGVLEDERLQQGQISVFPSIVPHEVRTVTKGYRASLVGWYLGPFWI